VATAEGRWLDAVRRLRAIAQNGLAYADDPFDRARYEEVREVAAALASLGGGQPEELAATFAADAGHATPKIDVRAAAFLDERVVLVRNVDDGLWSLPGGWAEVGERPRQSAEKELLEESGYRGCVVDVVGVYDRDIRDRPRAPAHIWKLVFLCELEDRARAGVNEAEIDAVGCFGEEELPPLSGRTTPEQLASCFALARERSRPREVD
jgi:ADP-ribose pyrophosphatase YjhB (NUDIX family)